MAAMVSLQVVDTAVITNTGIQIMRLVITLTVEHLVKLNSSIFFFIMCNGLDAAPIVRVTMTDLLLYIHFIQTQYVI